MEVLIRLYVGRVNICFGGRTFCDSACVQIPYPTIRVDIQICKEKNKR